MQLHEIESTAIPIDISLAASVIKRSQSHTGQQILSSMTDRQILSLWQFGLIEADILSLHNQSNGREPVKYPHLWVRSNLFKLVYAKWVQQESDAKALLKKIGNILPSPKSSSPEPKEESTKDWSSYYGKKRGRIVTTDDAPSESYCNMPPLAHPATSL